MINSDIIIIDNIQEIFTNFEDIQFKVKKGYSLNIANLGIINTLEQLDLVYKTLKAVNITPVKMGRTPKANSFTKQEILKYNAEGKTGSEIAEILNISRQTVYRVLKQNGIVKTNPNMARPKK